MFYPMGCSSCIVQSVVFNKGWYKEFSMRGKDNSYSSDRDEEVSGYILHINGAKEKDVSVQNRDARFPAALDKHSGQSRKLHVSSSFAKEN